jgi:uncharacterized membrane protein YphA (DoxX/SURF4 family)
MLLRTSAPPEYLLLRVALALDLVLDGCRQLRVHGHIGRSRLGELFDLSRGMLGVLGVLEVLAAVLLAAGLLTRAAAVVPVAVSVVAAGTAMAKIGTLSTPSGLTSLVSAVAFALIGVVVLIRGAGMWSVDAILTRRRR